ncbi:MAG: ATP synthase F0 subunit B [Deltaproteobacteria bacterium]|nr:MAG: ATP synthase F0 subunit B [Deltaproteobacteria bacterium]
MIDINNSLIIQAGLFIGLMLILNKVFFQPFLKFLEERRAKIQGDEEEASELQEEAERSRMKYDEGLDEGRLQAQEEKGHILDVGAQESRLLVEKVQKEIEEEAPKIRAQIEVESKQVLAELERRHGDMAKEIAEKILGRTFE